MIHAVGLLLAVSLTVAVPATLITCGFAQRKKLNSVARSVRDQKGRSFMKRKLKMGMVGGGRGAFIGAIHRMGACLDGKIE
jgi:hypothetical protein